MSDTAEKKPETTQGATENPTETPASSESLKGSEAQPPVKDKKESDSTTESSEVDDEGSESDSSSSGDELNQQMINLMLKQMMSGQLKPPPPPQKILSEPTLEAVAEGIKEGKFKNIICMTGAGISVAAGIPDFRTPGTGLYSNLQKYNLPFPEAVFEINFFRENPNPFFTLAKELYPGLFNATKTHYFIRLLHDKGVLLRNFTQNIDTLEMVAGIPDDKLVFAHGSFSEAHCIECKAAADVHEVKTTTLSGGIPRCKDCKTGLVKPDIIFFGESLPKRFFDLIGPDFSKCDLLIILGTSLSVQPFAGLIHKVGTSVPRVLINREKVGTADPRLLAMGVAQGLHFGEGNVRDVPVLGNLEDNISKFAELLGWSDDLKKLVEEGTKAFEMQLVQTRPAPGDESKPTEEPQKV